MIEIITFVVHHTHPGATNLNIVEVGELATAKFNYGDKTLEIKYKFDGENVEELEIKEI